jgi:fimbrial chaperone protein
LTRINVAIAPGINVVPGAPIGKKMLKKMRILPLLGTVIIISAHLFATQAWAISVEPLVLDVASAGKDASQSFKVVNNDASAMPVELNVFRMELNLNGEPRYEPAESDFLLYPPQANIPKGGAQVFRIQWIGDPEIKTSHNYRISVSQIPLKQPEGTSGVQIVMSFGVMVGVSPVHGKADVVVTGAMPAKGGDGKRVAALHVKNTGNKHAYLRNAAISVSGGGWSANLTASEVRQKVGLGIIQPGKERRFLLPIEVPAGVKDITASIDYQPEK